MRLYDYITLCKLNIQYIISMLTCSYRRISTINRWWKENGYDLDKIWGDIDDVVIKTLISISEILTHNYRTCFPNHVRGSACFEILGFDVMFDRKLKPSVVEVS